MDQGSTFRRVISISLATVACVALSLAGCAKPGAGAGITRTTLVGAELEAHAQLVKDGDAAFALRADRAQLELAIAKYTEAVGKKDDDYQTYEKLARALYLLADGHLFFERDTKEAEFLATYERGYGAALRGLQALSPDVEKKMRLGIDVGDTATAVGKDGVGLMYWYATNLGKWANSHDDISVVLKYKDRVVKLMTRVTDLDNSFFYGAPDRYWGAFYAIAPSFAGGDLDKSYKHFQASLKAAPTYPATYTLIAENYATKKLDEALFKELVQKVMDFPADVMPGMEAETAVEKKKAEQLRKRYESGDIVF